MKTVWTDYPDGNMKQVVVVDYDHNKYCLLADGSDVKAGYLYRSRRKVQIHRNTLKRWFPKEDNHD